MSVKPGHGLLACPVGQLKHVCNKKFLVWYPWRYPWFSWNWAQNLVCVCTNFCSMTCPELPPGSQKQSFSKCVPQTTLCQSHCGDLINLGSCPQQNDRRGTKNLHFNKWPTWILSRHHDFFFTRTWVPKLTHYLFLETILNSIKNKK